MLGCPTAPGCLCLWGTLFCVGGRPPSISFFLAISSVRSSRPRPYSRSNHTPAQPDDSTEPGPEGKGGAIYDGCRGWPMRGRQELLRSAFVALPVGCFDVDMCENDKRQSLKKLKVFLKNNPFYLCNSMSAVIKISFFKKKGNIAVVLKCCL